MDGTHWQCELVHAPACATLRLATVRTMLVIREKTPKLRSGYRVWTRKAVPRMEHVLVHKKSPPAEIIFLRCGFCTCSNPASANAGLPYSLTLWILLGKRTSALLFGDSQPEACTFCPPIENKRQGFPTPYADRVDERHNAGYSTTLLHCS